MGAIVSKLMHLPNSITTQSIEMNTSENTPSDHLFGEFSPVSRKEWTDKATADLKGADLMKKIQWNTVEGISLDAKYFRREIEELPHLGSYPGSAPFVRGNTPIGNAVHPWSIAQTFDIPDHETLYELIDSGIQNGQSVVGLKMDSALMHAADTEDVLELAGRKGVQAHSLKDMQAIVTKIPDETDIDIYGGLSSPAFLAMSVAAGRQPKHVEFDPIAELLRSGTLSYSLDTAMKLMADSIRFVRESETTVIGISGETFHNAGASAVEELACVLAVGVEYMSRLRDAGLALSDIAKHMRFTFPVGTRFFMEVAKLRAARLLWARVVKHFGTENDDDMKMRMHVRSSWWNQTANDPYVNMLRTTVEGMAGAIGGAESMYMAPFDDVAGSPGRFSHRIARNTQIILQEESQLTQVGDPAAGSYYVEQLTDQVARKSWELFQGIETQGGMIAAMQSGYVQKRILATADMRKDNISRRKSVIVGTNQYPNLTEKKLAGPAYDPEKTHKDVCAAIAGQREERDSITDSEARIASALIDDGNNLLQVIHDEAGTGILISEIGDILREANDDPLLVKPLPQFRASEEFEQLRETVENAEKRPRVFLATMGPVFWRRARATFASGFFGAAGMDITDNIGFETARAAAQAAIADNADIVVACSDDESYRDSVPQLIEELKAQNSQALVIVAGNPKDDIDTLTSAGVHAFIHARSDVGKTLAELIDTLEIDVQ